MMSKTNNASKVLKVKPEGLQAEAMLVRLNIKQFPLARKSKPIADAAAKAVEADERAVGGRKFLLGAGQRVGGKATSPVDLINQVANSARTYHYRSTLPWDKGLALLTGKLFECYCGVMERFAAEFYNLLDKRLLPVYPQLVVEDKKLHGKAYDDSEYPDTVEALKKRYKFQYLFEPIPAVGDIRVEVSKEREAFIRKQVAASNERFEARIVEAHKEIYRRLQYHIRAFHTKMTDPDADFHSTIISNITDMIELAPSLDIHDDAELTHICAAALPLTLYEAKVLRKDVTLRPNAAKSAGHVLNMIDAALLNL
jgi:hypothetical protein